MNRAIYVTLLCGMLLMLLSSCAAPKTDASDEQLAPVVVTPPVEKPTPVTEEKTLDDIAQTKAEKQDIDLDHVKNVVKMRQAQLRNIYKEEIMTNPSQGILLVKLNIDDQGMVQNPEVSVETGNFSPEFVNSVSQDLLNWRFLVRSPVTYTFRIELN